MNLISVESIVAGIVSHLDLTSLDSLARTSRAMHCSLVQSRAALLATTLRCSNEIASIDTKTTPLHHASRANFGTDAYANVASRRTADTSKASRCARDMVGECRRCAAVICRASISWVWRFSAFSTPDRVKLELRNQASGYEPPRRASPPSLHALRQSAS